jgi:hypothetical protein
MTTEETLRTEQEIFEELQALCTRPGYVHVLARIAVRDNMVVYDGVMTPEAMATSYDPKRTIRTEFTTLLGLMLRGPVDFTRPDLESEHRMLERTHALLEDIHDCLKEPMMAAIVEGVRQRDAGLDVDEKTIFARGDVMREPIFYGGESAYSFQYRDFAPQKYGRDDEWLRANKGFGIADAHAVVTAASLLPGEKLADLLPERDKRGKDDWTVLPGFALSVDEIAAASGVNLEAVRSVLEAFTAPQSPCNGGFKTLGDFNLASALPLVRAPDGRYVLLQAYGLIEALYDSPFYWMAADKTYQDQAFAHRGAFTEEFVAARLATVFGASNVHLGVTVRRGSNHVTDIDVLVTFAGRAIVLQCKSKRLTLEARRGNDLRLRDDFKKAVQHAYDQAYLSAASLGDSTLRFVLGDGSELKLTAPRAVYPVCVVADHYPALTVQARHFLNFTTNDVVHGPLATDVFMIDTMAEMLTSPLRFLSYLDRRVGLADRINTINEHALLGYHLSKNLWVDPNVSIAMIAEEFSIDLDTAMTVRRDGLVGLDTPKGILDRFAGTLVGRILAWVERSDNPALLNLGFELLTLSGETMDSLNESLAGIAAQTRKDGAPHDFTLVFEGTLGGITLHCSPLPTAEALGVLKRHCEYRKYLQRAGAWFGLLVRQDDGMPKAGMELRFPWKHDEALDEATKDLAAYSKPIRPGRRLGSLTARKIGRNQPCPCGSGRKYKSCHMP